MTSQKALLGYHLKRLYHEKCKIEVSLTQQITFLTVFPRQQGVAEIPPAFSVHCNRETNLKKKHNNAQNLTN